MALKWGICSAAKIAQDFVEAVHTLPSEDHKIVAVAARNLKDAEKFAKEHKIPKAYEGYHKLAEDKDIEIVYIGSRCPQHFEHTKLMLQYGKHVLCEKPFNITQKQTKRLVEIARKNKLFLMEAVWSRFFPAYLEAKRLIDSGAIGDVLFASVHFGQDLNQSERLQNKESGGGSTMDLGVYCLQFQQFIFRGLKPIKVVANGHLNRNGVDESCGAVTTYPNGKMALISTSLKALLPNEGVIVGTKGTLRLPNFWCPTQLITPEKTLEFPLPKSDFKFLHINSAGLAYEAEAVRRCIRAGKLECPNMPLDESIQIAELMDMLRHQVGCVFPQDSQEF